MPSGLSFDTRQPTIPVIAVRTLRPGAYRTRRPADQFRHIRDHRQQSPKKESGPLSDPKAVITGPLDASYFLKAMITLWWLS